MQGIIESVSGTTIIVDNGPFGKVKYYTLIITMRLFDGEQ